MAQLAIGALLTALVGVAAALVTSRLEHRRWLRQERLKAYTELVSFATTDLMQGYTNVANAALGLTTPAESVRTAAELAAFTKHQDAFNARLSELHQAIDRTQIALSPVLLLGPPSMRKLARGLVSTVSDESTLPVLKPDGTVDKVNVEGFGERIRAHLDAFLVAADDVLGTG